MRFSIISAIYNQKEYLPQLIDSLENQTFKDFELQICDDGSNDGTKEYLKSISPNFQMSYHRQRHNGNLSKNINQGIKKANGEYCVFIMGDSFPEKNYLEVLDEWVNPDSLVCGIRAYLDGIRMVEMDYRLNKRLIPSQPALLVKEPFNLATGNGLTIPTEAMRKYGGWNEKFKVRAGEDNEIMARLYYKGYLFWSIPQLILYHHYHKNPPPQNVKLLSKLVSNYAS